MKQTMRTFIAVDIAPNVKSQVLKATKALRRDFPSIRWVDDAQFHVTLKFLGDVPATEIYQLIKGVEKACQTNPQFDLVFEDIGAFPNVESPRSIWVGVTDGVDEICALANSIDNQLFKLGYPPEHRGFTPHMTLGRIKRETRLANPGSELLANAIENEGHHLFGCSAVDEVVVYSSELSRSGPQYDVLATIPLPFL